MKRKQNKKKRVNHSNGWFMVCDPKSKRIVGGHQQIMPERNQTVTDCHSKVLPQFPGADTVTYDRNCGYAPTASKVKALK